ncbi:MAG: sensor domain-containing protein, partial [Dehalococcoidia bacterium]
MSYLTQTFRNVYPSDRNLVEKIFTPLWDLRTYIRGVHMLLMFPLGIAYFVFFVTTMSVGGSLIWTFVGPAILLATLFISRWLGDFETKSVEFVSD